MQKIMIAGSHGICKLLFFTEKKNQTLNVRKTKVENAYEAPIFYEQQQLGGGNH